MKFLYLVSSRMIPDLRDAKNTIQALKDNFNARCVGTSPLGLVYGTDTEVPAEKREELHIAVWE